MERDWFRVDEPDKVKLPEQALCVGFRESGILLEMGVPIVLPEEEVTETAQRIVQGTFTVQRDGAVPSIETCRRMVVARATLQVGTNRLIVPWQYDREVGLVGAIPCFHPQTKLEERFGQREQDALRRTILASNGDVPGLLTVDTLHHLQMFASVLINRDVRRRVEAALGLEPGTIKNDYRFSQPAGSRHGTMMQALFLAHWEEPTTPKQRAYLGTLLGSTKKHVSGAPGRN